MQLAGPLAPPVTTLHLVEFMALAYRYHELSLVDIGVFDAKGVGLPCENPDEFGKRPPPLVAVAEFFRRSAR